MGNLMVQLDLALNERILPIVRVTWWQWELTKATFRSGTLVLGKNSLPWKDTRLELVRTCLLCLNSEHDFESASSHNQMN